MKRKAFTLVELLVVIAIIGVLVGLLLPAVQAAREAARRMSCANNMVQVSLAIHHHEFNMEHLPSGVTDPQGPIRSEEDGGKHISWMTHILPYIEQQNAFEQFNFELTAYDQANEAVRYSQVPPFRCPSNPFMPSSTGPQGGTLGTSDYAGCHHDSETPIDEDNNGLFYRNSETRFSEVTDGLSHTIMIGEHKGDADELGWVSGTRATLRNTGAFKDFEPWDEQRKQRKPLDVGGFDSWHQGGGHFALADGAIVFLTHSIDPPLYQQLAHRADGKLITEEF